jgi:hypothetical protein
MKAIQKTRHTLGLAMIMKDEVEDLDRIINDYGKYFDKIYVTVTDRKTYTALSKRFPAKPAADSLVELSYFKWIDHFGKARRFNQQQIKTDYWMWIDTDDEIEGAENIPSMVEYMVTNDLDVVWFLYDYVRRVNLSEPGSISWRERIVKTAPNLAWNDVAVHETLDEAIQGDIREELHSNVIIKHRKTAEQFPLSRDRNKLILEKDWLRAPNAVTGYYLGGTLTELGDYEGAIEKLSFAAEHSDIRPVKFGAWENLYECYFRTGDYNAALIAIGECIAIDPDHPGPWYKKFTVYGAMGLHDEAMQSAETAMSKRIQGNLEIVSNDPTWYQYRGPFAVAQAYLSIGNVERAHQLYQEVKKIAPGYIDEISKATSVQWGAVFEQAYKDKLT